MFKILIELFVITIAWFLIVSFFAFYTSIHPKKFKSNQTPASFDFEYEKVIFKTEDGLTLKGWFVPSKSPPAKTIIVLHGYPAEKGDVLNWAIFLQEKYHLFFFDFRYFGESEGKYTTVGYQERMDLKAAVKYLSTRKDTDPQKIGVMGFSLGGAVALISASEIPQIKAVVADSPYATLEQMTESLFQRFFFLKKPMVLLIKMWARIWLKVNLEEVSPVASVENSTTPLLLIHGEKDRQIPAEHSRKIFQSAKEPKEIWIVSGADHSEAYYQNKEIYEQKVLEFFGRWLGV